MPDPPPRRTTLIVLRKEGEEKEVEEKKKYGLKGQALLRERRSEDRVGTSGVQYTARPVLRSRSKKVRLKSILG